MNMYIHSNEKNLSKYKERFELGWQNRQTDKTTANKLTKIHPTHWQNAHSNAKNAPNKLQICTQKLINLHKYDKIICAGCAASSYL